ncbi:MAG: hypothetical protein ABSF35_17045 [Polyangia bacterium]
MFNTKKDLRSEARIDEQVDFHTTMADLDALLWKQSTPTAQVTEQRTNGGGGVP